MRSTIKASVRSKTHNPEVRFKPVLAVLNAKYSHTSLALRYLYSYCRRDFPTLIIKEYNINQDPAMIRADLYRERPDLLAFSCYIWNIEETIEVARELKKVSPETLVVFGGPEVSYEYTRFLAEHPFVDIVVVGEGEKTFHRLLGVLQAAYRDVVCPYDIYPRPLPASLRDIPGLCYRETVTSGEADDSEEPGEAGKPEDSITFTGDSPPIEDLSELPWPYEGEDLESLKKRIVYFESSRGCPYRCQYCLSALSKGVRYFPVEKVEEQLSRLIEAEVEQVRFVDRTFNCNKKRAAELFRFLAERASSTPSQSTTFQFEISADLFDEEMLNFLDTAPRGLFQFEIGVQTANELVLEMVKRKSNLDKLAQAVRRLVAGGRVGVHLDLIAGLPGETFGSFLRSFNYVYSLRPTTIQLGFLKLIKGSGIRDRADKWGYTFTEAPPYEVLSNNWLSYDDLLRIKGMCDIVDTFYNPHRVDETMRFIVDNYYGGDGARFFDEFGAYWRDRGHQWVGHKAGALYTIFRQFCIDSLNLSGEELDRVSELLRFDFLMKDEKMERLDWFPIESEEGRGGRRYAVSHRILKKRVLDSLDSLAPDSLTDERSPAGAVRYTPTSRIEKGFRPADRKTPYETHEVKDVRRLLSGKSRLEFLWLGRSDSVALEPRLLLFDYTIKDPLTGRAVCYEIPAELGGFSD